MLQGENIETKRRELISLKESFPIGSPLYEYVERELVMILRNNGITHG